MTWVQIEYRALSKVNRFIISSLDPNAVQQQRLRVGKKTIIRVASDPSCQSLD